jgi:RND family efflux transporter MFP subunit|tara:strand:- start:656 stop:1786 length:1131 start_codon:yes stop_codon:yes gene_type:complete
MNSYIKKYSPLIIISVSIIIFVLMIRLRPEAKFEEPKIIPQLVETMVAYPSEVGAKISSQGTIRPEHEIFVTSELSGKVTWVSKNFLDGAGFQMGDTLMKIEKRDYELALISTESSLFQARLALEREEAEANLASIEWKRVGKGDASSLTLREPQLAQARAVLAAAEAAYEQSKRNLERTSIIAPFNGRVRKKMVDLGTNLIPGSRLADIYATASFEVRLPIADKDIPFLGIPLDGTSIDPSNRPEVRLSTSYGGDELNTKGFIVRSESEIDPKTRMISAIATIPISNTNSGFKVGMFVNAEINGLSFPGVTVVPRSAVKDNMIWVVIDEKLRRKSVEVIRFEKDFAFISDGLNKNDRILITRLSSYVDGMPVRLN